MKTAKLLTTATAALGFAAGVAAAQDVEVEKRYMVDAEGKLYEVTLVEIDESEVDPQVSGVNESVSERAEEMGADGANVEADSSRLVLTEAYSSERTQEQTTGEVSEIEIFEDEQAEDEMVDEDASR